MNCADFFCGIGGFHVAARNLGMDVVFACDIDKHARKAYAHNYGLNPWGDIRMIDPDDIPDFDFLFAGFPCQPFSIIGKQRGLSDPRGTLFFELSRFIESKQPSGIVLENVKQLSTIDKGKVLRKLKEELGRLGYDVKSKVLNALDFGLPHKRERTIIVASRHSLNSFAWPNEAIAMKPLEEILELDPDLKHYASKRIQRKRMDAHATTVSPSIWHENKGGNVSSHEWSCALRAGASYNYLLVDGKRRLTSREQLRLQGFPDTWDIVCSDSETRKQTGNAVPVPMVQDVIGNLKNHIFKGEKHERMGNAGAAGQGNGSALCG